MEKLLDIQDVELIYHSPKSETHAIKNLNISISAGEFISIVGPSGCGKSTILSLIAGILKPTSGKVLINGEEVNKPGFHTGYMFQRDNLFEWLNIWKNVTLGLSLKKQLTQSNNNYAKTLLNKYGLSEFINHYPNELSGGMRQRVALIRTLCLKPDLLLLDEPFSALDYQTRLVVQDDVFNIIKTEQKTAILVTHDISEAISMSSKIIVLTQRPGTVKNIINLDFNPELTPLERRKEKNFNIYFNKVWEELL